MVDKQKEAAKKFAETWKDKGYEKGESQPFWLQLLHDVFGVENPYEFITFEEQVMMDNTSFIDGYIPKTKVLIEQKSLGKNLNQAIKQSDGTLLTPIQQAIRYIPNMPVSKHPRYVVTCNFAEFWVYDMEKPHGEPEKIRLEDLPKDYYRLQFLVETGKENLQKQLEVSVKAGELVGLLYDAFAKQYADPTTPHAMHSLNVLCVRLVFCLYAEDAGVFGKRDMFHDYLDNFPLLRMRRALYDLFSILNTKMEDRDPYLKDEDPLLAAFPYVNGGLFANEDIEIPVFTEEIRDLLLKEASLGFDWSEISPTIFGAVFESTLNPETRRSGGMHYTSVENIHKVIDPLFLDDIKKEFASIRSISVVKIRNSKLMEFQQKLASLRFLDPACGSGNFHTETYISLRRIENEILTIISDGQSQLAWEEFNPIRVSLSQFHGIEINEFAVSVAKTALWIAESQMMAETEKIVRMQLDFLPLKTSANIVQGNALRLDWETIVPRSQLSYIMGNPPFSGARMMGKKQKQDVFDTFPNWKNAGDLDYVCCWYKKAADYMKGTSIRAALVSTNSITQGIQVANLWKPLLDIVHIDFAYRTFRWDSEASLKAHVHCVIVGFSTAPNDKPKIIYDGDRMQEATNINGYLMDAPNLLIESRRDALCDIPDICKGFQATDNGSLILDEEEKIALLKAEPEVEHWIRPYSMGVEFIHKIPRYCLWLVDIKPNELKQSREIFRRVSACKEWREAATPTGDAYKLKDVPHLFRPCKLFQDAPYIAVPLVSSEKRRYIPMGYIDNGMIPGNNLFSIFNATLYHFGMLTSNVHMAWMRAIGGRLKSDYRYSKDMVYNNFPWPEPTEEQRARIEETAKAILDARALYPDSSLADLYDEVTMPPELRTAHQRNDRAVCAAYGWTSHSPEFQSESACVSTLMKMYLQLTAT